MLRKIAVWTVLAVFLLSNLVSAQNGYGEMTALEKTATVEKIFYGSEQTGSLVERIAKLERDAFGLETNNALLPKIDSVYAYTKQNTAVSPSLLICLNAVEWTLTHSVSFQPVKARIENLERTLLGNSGTGAFHSRISKLAKLAFADGQIVATETAVGKDTLVRIKMLSALDSRKNRAGDTVVFRAAEDVYAGGLLVIAKGAKGLGKVKTVEHAKNFGRDAKIEVIFDSIEAVDGGLIPTVLGEKAKEETKSMALAAGASVAGIAIFGPVGIVGGAFVQGKHVEIPAGSEMFIQVKQETKVHGIAVK